MSPWTVGALALPPTVIQDNGGSEALHDPPLEQPNDSDDNNSSFVPDENSISCDEENKLSNEGDHIRHDVDDFDPSIDINFDPGDNEDSSSA
eukprot:1280819-Ditylum_brightwellii.AAC.1